MIAALLSLLKRLTVARAKKLDNLDDTISSRAPASTALSKNTWTDTKAGLLDTNINSRAPASTALSKNTWTDSKAAYLDDNISTKAPAATALSNQIWTNLKADHLDISISSRAPANTALSNQIWTNLKADHLDISISSRAPANTALSNQIWTNDKAGYLDARISTRSTDAGVWSHPTRTLTESVSANVIKSIQRGYLSVYDANANISFAYYLTISPVDVAKTMIIWYPHTYNYITAGYALLVSSSRLKLSWTAPASPGGPGAVCIGSWQVIEFY